VAKRTCRWPWCGVTSQRVGFCGGGEEVGFSYCLRKRAGGRSKLLLAGAVRAFVVHTKEKKEKKK